MLNILKIKKNVLIVLLASSDVNRVRRSYDSIINSKKTISFDIEIIVNSLNKNFFLEIKDEFKKEKIKIIETESDGGCGKGKNSVLEHFREHKKKYDYLMQIDADDFFYPTAFYHFEKMLSKSPDIIGLQAADILIKSDDKRAVDFFERSKDKKNNFLHPINDNFNLHSWNENEFNLNMKFPKNVFKKVSQQFPPDRILFLSESIIKNELDLFLPENIRKYTDYIFSIRLYEKAINNNYSYCHFSNSSCYIYDRTNENAVSSTYSEFNQTRDFFDEKFPEIIKETVEKCDYRVDFSIIPYFETGSENTLSTSEKIDFLKKNII